MDEGTLMIESVQNEDLGTVECVAQSKAGEVKSRRAVFNTEVEDGIDKSCGFEYHTTQRPRFLQLPVDQEVVEGHDLRIHCNATGQPGLSITWFLNDRPLALAQGLRVTVRFFDKL